MRMKLRVRRRMELRVGARARGGEEVGRDGEVQDRGYTWVLLSADHPVGCEPRPRF